MKKNNDVISELLEGKNVVAVLCLQFGDTGKGKFVDILSSWADIIVRGGGGNNCGHTTVVDYKTIVTHLIPSGISYDSQGKINIIGSGTVVDPIALSKEMIKLKEIGITFDNFLISHKAHFVTIAEILYDRIQESVACSGKIGSTGRGIGPAYSDFIGRNGLFINDLLNAEILKAKLKKHFAKYKTILKNYDSELVMKIMHHSDLGSWKFYDAEEIFNLEAIYRYYLGLGDELHNYICDTDEFVRVNLGKKKILLEGAQGTLLSVKYGTYPYVTSSDCSLAGLAEGAGLQKSDVDLSLGIFKGFYETRVGCGPFPTELGGVESDNWCNGKGNRERELETDLDDRASVNSPNEFYQGIGIRRAGNEYGATTGRPRRVGWLDLPLLKYAIKINGPHTILTKVDVLNEVKIIRICTDYIYRGFNINYAGKEIHTGDVLDVAITDSEILQYCEAFYKEFPGWLCDISECTNYESLPKELKTILEFIIQESGIKPWAISIGADREETIFL